MPKQNPYLIPKENIKKVEEVREVRNEIPSFEEFMKSYENDERLNESYKGELEGYGSVGERKVCGPMHRGGSSSSNHFSVSYSFKHGVDNEKYFFEESGSYSNSWKISGDLVDLLHGGLNKLWGGEVRVVKLVSGCYERDKSQEEEIIRCLKEDMTGFLEMEKNGRVEYNVTGREFDIPRSRTIVNRIE